MNRGTQKSPQRKRARLTKGADGEQLTEEELARLRAKTATGDTAGKAEGDDDDDQDDETKKADGDEDLDPVEDDDIDPANKADAEDGYGDHEDDDDDLDKADDDDTDDDKDDDASKADTDDDDDEDDVKKADDDDDDDDETKKGDAPTEAKADKDDPAVTGLGKGGRVASAAHLRKAVNELARRVDAKDPSVRQDMLYAKSKVGKLSPAERKELVGLLDGTVTKSLRAKVSPTLSKATQSALASNAVVREALGTAAHVQGKFADELQDFRKSTEGTQVLMGRAVAEMGRQVLEMRSQMQAQHEAMTKAMRMPGRAPRAHGVAYAERGATDQGGDGSAAVSKASRRLSSMIEKHKGSDGDRSELHKALFEVTYTGKVSPLAKQLIARGDDTI